MTTASVAAKGVTVAARWLARDPDTMTAKDRIKDMRRSALHSHLAVYDGRHTDALERVAVALQSDAGAAQTLVDIAAAQPCGLAASAATWVLLRLCKDSRARRLEPALILRLRTVLTEADHWETRLHVLQTLSVVEVSSVLIRPQRESIAKAAMRCATDPQPFVVAWAVNVLGLLGGDLSKKMQAHIALLIHNADRHGPASTRARLRQLRKAGRLEWLDHIPEALSDPDADNGTKPLGRGSA